MTTTHLSLCVFTNTEKRSLMRCGRGHIMRWHRRLLKLSATMVMGTCLALLLLTHLVPDELKSRETSFLTADNHVMPAKYQGVPGQRYRTPERTILNNAVNNESPNARVDRGGLQVPVVIWPPKDTAPYPTPSSDELRKFNNQFNCDISTDCGRLHKLLDKWNSTKPKAAIYVLTRAVRLRMLRTMLQRLDDYFNDRFKYPVIIFHEEDLTADLRETIRSQYSRSQVYFHEVSFSVLPSYIPQPLVASIPCTSTIGYRHMCRFQAKTVYELPILRPLEYIWRLDDDSLLTNKTQYDIFAYMRDNDFSYGYKFITRDNLNCIKGLWNATSTYIRINDIEPYFFKDWKQPHIFYNNFEVSKVSLWTGDKYRDYIKYVDRLGGIYEHRWGDAPIRSLAVSMFVPRNRTHRFVDIGYKHGS